MLADSIARLLVRELEGFRREVALYEDDGSLWLAAPGVSNPAGNLALHVAGNLQEYVGRVLGGSGYVRDRPAEFGRRAGTRTEIDAELRAAIGAVEKVLPGLSPERLEAEYPEKVDGLAFSTERFLLHLCTHAAYHLGQAVYLRRMRTADVRSSGPIPLRAMSR